MELEIQDVSNVDKLLFLDCDGVLNSYEYKKKLYKARKRFEMFKADPDAVEILNLLLDRDPEIKFVLTSVWRLNHTTLEVYNIFVDAGFRHKNPFVGRTSNFGHQLSTELVVEYKESGRGLEIAEWLDKFLENNIKSSPYYFVIVDDSSDMWPLMDNLVRISNMYGLIDRHIEPILNILSKPNIKSPFPASLRI